MHPILLAILLSFSSSAIANVTDAQIEAGRKQYIRCIACHETHDRGRQMSGPHLKNIINRPSASVENYRYTSAFKAIPYVWTEDNLEAFLQSPQKLMPGLCMPFTGLHHARDREALMAYLRSISRETP